MAFLPDLTVIPLASTVGFGKIYLIDGKEQLFKKPKKQ